MTPERIYRKNLAWPPQMAGALTLGALPYLSEKVVGRAEPAEDRKRYEAPFALIAEIHKAGRRAGLDQLAGA
jgi:hypothetical protein